MKAKKPKKEIEKFDLEKFSVAKLKNLQSIRGGKNDGDDKTITQSMNKDGQTF